ncbi:MAG TPA: ATP-binding protein, partial [Spirochaetia bacterium]|nr:ATP-binding protein [Spirochaetia bacterium]
PITMITTFFTQLQKARGATESITALLDEPEETERGIGISAQDLPHVFDRFFKADRSRTQANGAGGSGLGLSIVQRIVALHSGTVTAESAGLDRGSCFTVRLPLSPPGASEGPAAGPTARSAASAAPQG